MCFKFDFWHSLAPRLSACFCILAKSDGRASRLAAILLGLSGLSVALAQVMPVFNLPTSPYPQWQSLLDRVAPRIIKVGLGSGVLLGREGKTNQLIYISALHSHQGGLPGEFNQWPPRGSPAVRVRFDELREWQPRGARDYQARIAVAFPGNSLLLPALLDATKSFVIYRPEVASSPENRAVAPEVDFVLGVMTGESSWRPDPLQGQRQLGDYPVLRFGLGETAVPDGVVERLSLSKELSPGPREMSSGQTVVMLGHSFEFTGALAWSVGRVADEGLARQLVERAREESLSGEREPAFDPRTEILLIGSADPGMSGGGVFSLSGELLAILQRSTVRPVVVEGRPYHYVRALRMDFIVELCTPP